jgi:hypothetical protein
MQNLCDMFKEMSFKNTCLKLITITNESHTEFDWHRRFMIKPISNSTKYKLY